MNNDIETTGLRMDADVREVSAPKRLRGFAAMSPERQREIASRGGRSAHAKGKAHTFSSEEAVAAGAKGGLSAAQRKKERALA